MLRICIVCEGPRDDHGARGMCSSCYNRARYKAGKLNPIKIGVPCSVPNCGKFVKQNGFCARHYKRFWRHGDPLGGAGERRSRDLSLSCVADGCTKSVAPNGYKYQMCNQHGLRMRRHGTLELQREQHSDKTREQRDELEKLWKRRDYEKNAEAYKARTKAWAKANPAKASIAGRKRTQALNQATPRWLTEAQWAEMNTVYDTAWSIVRTTGVKREVDHIVPLRHKQASGLHVFWNLAISPKADNRRKSNKADLDKIALDQMHWLATRGLALSG